MILKTMCRQWLVLIGALIFSTNSIGNPTGAAVSEGIVSIQSNQNTVTVLQSSQKAIINWQSFNIKSGEHTHFQQPSGGVVLNRISPTQGASQIYGTLTATGKIILVNQAGIYFGPNAFVNVGGVIASTSDISNQNFLAGKYSFDQPSQYNGSIVNEGMIHAAEYGLVALMGTSVSNEGIINARLGTVALASGNKFTVNFSGDGLINFTINEAATNKGQDPRTRKSMQDGVNNSGSIFADGGRILMKGRAAANVLDHVVNMSGVAIARSVKTRRGQIILSGGTAGKVTVSGKLIASGTRSKGGTIKILGNTIHLTSSAVVDVTGNNGGGEILVGGNLHGAGTEPNADFTTIDKGSLLNASALQSGNGGRVIVWSNNTTSFSGDILAKGGIASGNGGFSEISGHKLLEFNGTVDLTTPTGVTGTLLLDPADLTICTSCTTNAAFDGTSNTYSAGGTGSTLLVTDLTNALNSANIVVQTSATGTGNGDIFVNTPI
ncbi:MAG: filamentous hemagglutinin N-terminal domain-containing protein, partial [Gammaproteobacteria bacterium]|nr:filamentous hemagglutinin N-terminal domain-containing protein [Gammaproteobacteria bacterium]